MEKIKDHLFKFLVPLPWDSQHFGISVGQIISPEITDSELWDILSYAKEKGFHLIYWAACPEQIVPLPLLQHFSGSLIIRRISYQRNLSKLNFKFTPDSNKNLKDTFTIFEYPQSPANQQLLALALLGGSHSRFQADPGIPREKFVSMYHTWINRSSLHEIADVVFVVADSSKIDEYIGVITGSAENKLGRIGLLGVQKDLQGQGIGSLLIETLHDWMLSKGISISEAVTQQDNVRACRFYERSGYRLAFLQHHYHFWVQL